MLYSAQTLYWVSTAASIAVFFITAIGGTLFLDYVRRREEAETLAFFRARAVAFMEIETPRAPAAAEKPARPQDMGCPVPWYVTGGAAPWYLTPRRKQRSI